MNRLLTGLVVLAMISTCFLVLRHVLPGNTPWGITVREWTKVIIDGNLAPPLERFRAHTGRYPTTKEGLQTLLVAPAGLVGRWRGPYLESLPRDSWNRRYWYRCPGIHNPKSYDLWSLGPDGVLSRDDIGNW